MISVDLFKKAEASYPLSCPSVQIIICSANSSTVLLSRSACLAWQLDGPLLGENQNKSPGGHTVAVTGLGRVSANLLAMSSARARLQRKSMQLTVFMQTPLPLQVAASSRVMSWWIELQMCLPVLLVLPGIPHRAGCFRIEHYETSMSPSILVNRPHRLPKQRDWHPVRRIFEPSDV